ncbi:MAG: glycosyltransferase family 39 protein [Proteobacteria bacterium]|nr:glycosyltransferase family 39 protein [Pseudomonadota bacterium]
MMSSVERRALVLLIALAFALDFLFYTGLFASDDTSYLYAARYLGGDRTHSFPPSLTNARLGINIPNAIFYWLTGGDVSWVAWGNCLYHLGLVALAFAIGRLLYDGLSGLVAAGIVATSPIFYVFAGAILPDNAVALWLALSLLCLLLAHRRTGNNLALYVAAGACIGVSYTCKETGLIMIVPAGVAVVLSAPFLRSSQWFVRGVALVAGLALVVAIEVLWLRCLTGEWVWRLSLVKEFEGHVGDLSHSQGYWPWERIPFAISELARYAPVVTSVLVIAAIVHAIRPGRNQQLLLFFWWPALYLTIGSAGFTSYNPPPIAPRYYAIMWMPGAVIVAREAVHLCRQLTRLSAWPKWLTAPLLLVSLTIASSWVEVQHNHQRAGNIYRASQVRSFVAAYEYARAEYPDLPIMLGPEFRNRMTTLFFPRAPADVYVHSYLSGRQTPPPAPPYIYLIEADGEYGAEGELLSSARKITEISAAPSRWHFIADTVGWLFGGDRPRPRLDSDQARATAVFLVPAAEDRQR